jgi:hypothetical protein
LTSVKLKTEFVIKEDEVWALTLCPSAISITDGLRSCHEKKVDKETSQQTLWIILKNGFVLTIVTEGLHILWHLI